MSDQEMKSLYGRFARKVRDENGIETYAVYYKDQEGIIEKYQLFPGIFLYVMDICAENAEDGLVEARIPEEGMITICHCQEGRFEAEYGPGQYIYIGQNDTVVHLPGSGKIKNSFPLLRFKGAVVAIRSKAANEFAKELSKSIGPVPWSFDYAISKLIEYGRVIVLKNEEHFNRLFGDIYNESREDKIFFIRLRVLEILAELSHEKGLKPAILKRFDEDRVEAVKSIRKLLIDDIGKKYTQEELSQMYSIPLTSLKECFKAVYGVPLNTYMREYRINVSASLLKTTDLSVAQISERVGYANQSKFAEVFKERMGISPMEYRNKN